MDEHCVAANASFEGWENYPMNLEAYDPITTNGPACSGYLSDLSSTLFCTTVESIKVDLIDVCGTALPINVDNLQISNRSLKTVKELEDYIRHRQDSKSLRVISIPQFHSLRPLEITEAAMRKVLSCHKVVPDFLSVLFACGEQPRASEEGSGNATVKVSTDNTYHICYLYRYVERNGRSPGNPWSIRQTGVYHRYSPTDVSNFWLLLHPLVDSMAQKRLNKLYSTQNSFVHLKANALGLHILLISSYSDNWRWYLKDLGIAFTKIARVLTAVKADISMTIDIREDYGLSFATLQELRHLEEKVIPLRANFQANMETFRLLKNTSRELQEAGLYDGEEAMNIRNSLSLFSSQLRGHILSVEILEKRIQGILSLLADALNLKNQATAEHINDHLLSLTRETVDDSATIRTITWVSLIYLPASFVATMFGMNLFSFDTSTSVIKIAKDFWIYLAFSIPLTMLTVGYWFLQSYVQSRKGNRSNVVYQKNAVKSTKV